MHLNETQKNIINKISEGSINDIFSFVSTHNNVKEFRYELKKILENKKKNSKNELFEDINIKLGNLDIFKNSNAKSNSPHQKINKEDFEISIELADCKYSVNPLNQTILYLPNLYTELLNFYHVWSQLEQNGLIFTMDKKITAKDAEIFIREKSESEGKYKNFVIKRDLEFADIKMTKDEESIVLSKKYLGKKIIPLPELNILIKNNYKTEDRLKYEAAKKQSWWAIWISLGIGIVSIILSTVSIISSNNLSDENTKFWVDNEKKRLEEYNTMNETLKIISEDLKEYKNAGELDKLSDKELSENILEINKTLDELQNTLLDE